MGYMADNARRFFHPAVINDMLSTFVPLIDGTKLDVGSGSFQPLAVFNLIQTECSVFSLLSHDILTSFSSPNLSSHVTPFLGVHKLIQVR
jgi:hypothetical protein